MAKAKTNTKQALVTAERNALQFEGALAIIFGFTAVVWPSVTVKALVYLFASFLVVDALILLITGLMRLGNANRSVLLLVLGLVQLGFGLYFFHHPILAFSTLVLLFGLALIVRGVFNFLHAFAIRGLATTKALHALLGVLGVIVGIIILGEPAKSGVAFVWILGLYALITGPVLIAMASDLDKVASKK